MAWADRYRYLADPELMPFPWQKLISSEYAATRRPLINMDRAMSEVAAGTPDRLGGPSGSTTALAVADSEHNLVSITKTIMSAFGSRVTIPGTGIIMNNGMYWFDPEPGKANSVGPGKKPLNNMAPLLVLKEGSPIWPSPRRADGKILNANLNILLNAAVLRDGDAGSSQRSSNRFIGWLHFCRRSNRCRDACDFAEEGTSGGNCYR